MHHYPFHISDFRSATMHLSIEEEVCLRRLLDEYYDTEEPLSLDVERLARRVRLDFELVSRILEEFFYEHGDGWRNERCDHEIGKYQAKANRAKNNGKRGGRPPVETGSVPSDNPEETGSVSKTNPDETGSKANQEPRTKNQEPISEVRPKPSAEPDPELEASFERFWTAYDRKVKRKTAWKAWEKLKPDRELAERITAAAEVYRRSTPDPHFRAHPSSWLNERRWDDEIVHARDGPSRNGSVVPKHVPDGFYDGNNPVGDF